MKRKNIFLKFLLCFLKKKVFLTVTAFSVLNSWTSTINSCFSAEGGMNSHVRESEQGSPVTVLEKKNGHKDTVNI